MAYDKGDVVVGREGWAGVGKLKTVETRKDVMCHISGVTPIFKYIEITHTSLSPSETTHFSLLVLVTLSLGEWYDAWPTEGGHAEMSPRNDLEYEFIKVRRRIAMVLTLNLCSVSDRPLEGGRGVC